eukprot:TRINITY_DN4486_c0_g1_i1.p1 TRINITY_DN4486_c0_g1~~TRINITY_DN4486_c0_g1_i1.p1  ORF type:complete len:271 (+),score=37.35 TRINITY_DN4486_c0_g1_i1:387-1199(+)
MRDMLTTKATTIYLDNAFSRFGSLTVLVKKDSNSVASDFHSYPTGSTRTLYHLERMASVRCSALCTLLFAGLVAFVEASHFRYGTLTFTKSPTDPQTVTYTLNMAMRRTYFGTPSVGQAVYDGYLYFGDGSSIYSPLTVNNLDTALDVVYLTWTGTKRYSAAGTYTPYWASCCRIVALQNNNEYDYRVWATMKLTTQEISKQIPVNNSPTSSILPIIPVPYAQVPFTYNIDTSDIEGDSRTFRMATATEQGRSGSVHPTGLSPPFTGVLP